MTTDGAGLSPNADHARETSRVIVSKSTIHGLGAFAARDFAARDVVLEIDDSRVVDQDHPLRPQLGEHEWHCDYLAGGRVVLMQLPERYINHSCDPNTYVRTIGRTRKVIAIRAIPSGEELTNDYLINCHGGSFWRCACGSARCRGLMVTSFFELPEAWQQEYLFLLDDWFVREHRERVEQLGRVGSRGCDPSASMLRGR